MQRGGEVKRGIGLPDPERGGEASERARFSNERLGHPGGAGGDERARRGSGGPEMGLAGPRGDVVAMRTGGGLGVEERGGGAEVSASHWPERCGSGGGRVRRGRTCPAARKELDLGFHLREKFGGRHIYIGRGS